MAVVGFIPDLASAENVISWTDGLSGLDQEVAYLYLSDESQISHEETLQTSIDASQHPHASLIPISGLIPIVEILEKCKSLHAKRLVIPDFDLTHESGPVQNASELLRSSSIETCLILRGDRRPDDIEKTLVIATRGVHDISLLNLAEEFRTRYDSQITISTIETQSDSHVVRAGKRYLKTLLHDATLDHKRYEAKVVVDTDRRRGILRCYENQDLVVVGRDEHDHIKSISHHFPKSTVLIVKRVPALSFQSLPAWLPRIHPADHADLLHDLRQGSRWNSDFILMLGLASAIATLGLLQNSPAVVIGSMLLAPLMTPMIGAGLALAEAAPRMAVRCSKTISMGFLLTLGVSMLIGLITPSRETLSPEILSRGDPNVLDLLIAVFSAVAATIAMSRPGIANAVAGVAIATALVPPVCSMGLSLSSGYLLNALGALSLFLTNLIAIIISSSVTFSLLGVSRERAVPRHRQFAQVVRVVLLTTMVVIAGPLSHRLSQQLKEGRPQTAIYPVTRALSRVLRDRIERDSGVEIILMGRSAVTDGLVIYLTSDHELPPSYADELRKLTRETMNDEELAVFVVMLDGQWLSSEDQLLTTSTP